MTPTRASSKYKTGLFYKYFLYAGSDEWVKASGGTPSTDGALIAVVAINRANLLAEIAVYEEKNYFRVLEKAKTQLEVAFNDLGIDERDKEFYNILYQTPRRTTELPALKPYSEDGLLKRTLKKILRKLAP